MEASLGSVIMFANQGDERQRAAADTTAHVEDDPGIRFLLSEIETARAFMTHDVTTSDKRVDVLLAIASASGAGLVALRQTQISSQDFLYVALLAALSLLIVGTVVFFESVEANIRAVRHIRALNQIRIFFASHYPFIEPALTLRRDAQHPKFRWFSGSRWIPMAINAAALTTVVTVAYLLARPEPLTLDGITLLVGAGAFLLMLVLQEIVAIGRYRGAEKRWRIDHPAQKPRSTEDRSTAL